jgi:hypothetical protein
MRIWDISPNKLCRSHLLGEHRELHAVWTILTKNKKGYSRHPEVLRWKNKLKALYLRHEHLVDEMAQRGYVHKSHLDIKLAAGAGKQNSFVDSYEEQIKNIRAKKCRCRV